ncbi:MAG: N,N-dimethylformamidase beta subunit family domain-containing protein, partial [Bryocella sp.]
DNVLTKNESRMHRTHKPETSLVGVSFTSAGAMTGAPYKVLLDKHWVFAGTDLKNGDLFGKESLHDRVPGGASGHETDKILPHSPKVLEHLAKGPNPNDGGADLVLFALGAGEVFSTGSITWVSSIFPDEKVSKITKNVLERFLKDQKRDGRSSAHGL